MASEMPPIIWASRPRGLTARPTSTAQTTLVTRGPVTAPGIFRPVVSGRQSISASIATAEWYSVWTAMPWAVPAGMALPQSPTSATLSRTARARGSFMSRRRNAYPSWPMRFASSSMTSSCAQRTLGE